MTNSTNGYEYSWDAAIEKDGAEFVLLPDGDYDFVIEKFDRGRHGGSEKLPACNKATLYLKIESAQGTATVKKDLFLHSTCEGLLCAFFTCIGQRQHGQKIQMNWGAVPGARGRARIGTREYNGNKYNEVKRFLEPAPGAVTPPAQQPTYHQQSFATPAAPNPGAFAGGNAGGYTPGKF